MPQTKEERLAELKARYFSNDPSIAARFNNTGRRGAALSGDYFTDEERAHLHQLKPAKMPNRDILRGAQNQTDPLKADFGGARTLAQWLMLADNPDIHYADVMDSSKYETQKHKAGQQVAEAIQAAAAGDRTKLERLTARAMEKYANTDVRSELGYALGLPENCDDETFRAATRENPAVCTEFIRSYTTNNKNLYQATFGMRESPSKDIQRKFEQRHTQNAIGSKFDQLRQCGAHHDYELIHQGAESYLEHVITKTPYTQWELYANENMDLSGTIDGVVLNQYYNAAVVDKYMSEQPAGGGAPRPRFQSDHMKRITTNRGIHSIETNDAFAALSQINHMCSTGMDIDTFNRTHTFLEECARASNEVYGGMLHLGYMSTVQTGEQLGNTISEFEQQSREQLIHMPKMHTEHGIIMALGAFRDAGRLLKGAAELSKELTSGSTRVASFAAIVDDEAIQNMADMAEGYQTLQRLSERALDKTLSTDERLIAKRTLQELEPILDGKSMDGATLKETVMSHEAAQRNLITASSDQIVESQAQAYLQGTPPFDQPVEAPFEQMYDEKQLFRDLPDQTGKKNTDMTLVVAEGDKKNLYKLGQKPEEMLQDEAVLKSGVAAFDATFGHLAEEHRHRAYRAAGLENPCSTFYIDGLSAKEYAEQHGIPANDDNLKAVVMSAVASGEHHVELGTMGSVSKGTFDVNVSSVNMDVHALDGQEGFFARKPSKKAERLHDDDRGQAQRQRTAQAQLREKFTTGMAQVMAQSIAPPEKSAPAVEAVTMADLKPQDTKKKAPDHAATVAAKPAMKVDAPEDTAEKSAPSKAALKK